jgi:hypothetical protein
VVGGTVVVVAGGLVVVVVVVEGADVVVVACVVEVVVDGTVAVVEVAGAVVVATVGMVVVASDVDVVAGTTAPVDVVSCPTLPAHTDATRQITVSTIQRRRAPTFVNAGACYALWTQRQRFECRRSSPPGQSHPLAHPPGP